MASKACDDPDEHPETPPPMCTSVTQVVNKHTGAIRVRSRTTAPQVKAIPHVGKKQNMENPKLSKCKKYTVQVIEHPKGIPTQQRAHKKQSVSGKFQATQVKPVPIGIKKANTALEALNGGKENYKVKVMPKASAFDEAIQSRIQSEIESFQNQVDLAKNPLLEHHNKKTKELKTRLEKCRGSLKKGLPLEEHKRLSKERKILDLKIAEQEQQKKEFEIYVCNQLSVLSSQARCITDEKSLQTKLKAVEKDLSREYCRFSAAIPINGRR